MMLDIKNEPIGRLLKIANQIFETYINNGLKEVNLTNSQIKILIYVSILNKSNMNVNQIDIQREFNLSNPTVTGILNRLEEKKFIKRINNGRCNKIIPTDRGLLFVDNGYRKYIMMENELLSNLNGKERDLLKELLLKIIINKGGLE